MPAGEFDPSNIPPYSVIVAPMSFDGGEHFEDKVAVVLYHEGDSALCIKATSQMKFFLNNPRALRGCVMYYREDSVFHQDTVITPGEIHSIPHSKLTDSNCVVGRLPEDFPDRLREAVNASVVMTTHQKRIVLKGMS